MKKGPGQKESEVDQSQQAHVTVTTEDIAILHTRESSPSNGLCAGAEFTMLAYLSFCFLHSIPIQIKKLKQKRHCEYFIECVPVHLSTGTIGFGWDNKLLLFHSTKKRRGFKKEFYISDNRVSGGYRKRVANLETQGFKPAIEWYKINRRQNPYLDKLNSYIDQAMLKLGVTTHEAAYDTLLELIKSEVK